MSEESKRKPPETLYEWMRDRYLERMEKIRREKGEGEPGPPPASPPSERR